MRANAKLANDSALGRERARLLLEAVLRKPSRRPAGRERLEQLGDVRSLAHLDPRGLSISSSRRSANAP